MHTPLCAKAGACVLSDVAFKGVECEGGEGATSHAFTRACPPPPSLHHGMVPLSPFPSLSLCPHPVGSWTCVVGRSCQGRGVHSVHSSCCSVTMRVFGGCSNGCCVFLFVLPCPVPVCSVRQHLIASCALVLLGSPHGVGFSPPLVLAGVHTMLPYACPGSGCDLLCGRWKVRGVVSDVSSRYCPHCPNVGHVLLKV